MSVKLTLNGLAAIKCLDISDVDYTWLHYSGFLVELGLDQFKFIHPDLPDSENVIETVPITIDQLHKLYQGILPKSELVGISTLVKQVILALVQYTPQPNVSSKLENPLIVPPLGAQEKTPATVKWPIFDKHKMKTAPTVPLIEATQMYQPVKGTSPSSRYYVVAGNDNMIIAARWRVSNKNLSVRIESPTQFVKSALTHSGFEWKDPYASIHLVCPNRKVANKALAASIASTELEFYTPMPHVFMITEKEGV